LGFEALMLQRPSVIVFSEESIFDVFEDGVPTGGSHVAAEDRAALPKIFLFLRSTLTRLRVRRVNFFAKSTTPSKDMHNMHKFSLCMMFPCVSFLPNTVEFWT
jgi:hypothetical protein